MLKNLGVTVDDLMKFAIRTVGLIKKWLVNITKETFTYLFATIVHPQLEYGIVIYALDQEKVSVTNGYKISSIR